MTANDSADSPILDLRPNDDESPLLLNCATASVDVNTSETSILNTIRVPSISRFRVTNVLRVFLFGEFLSLLIIWFAGSRTHSLIDDIIHFHLLTSIFDLVMVSTLKWLVLTVLLTELETRVILRLYRSNDRSSSMFNRYLLIGALLFISVAVSCFAIVKLILVVRHPYQLSGLSQSCIYIFLVCSLLELLGILWVVPYLRRLKLIEEQRTEPTVGKERVDLRRVFCLAKEERSLMAVGMLFLLVASGIEIVDILLFGRVIGYAVEQETMHLANVTVLIIFGIDLISSICTFLYSWIFDLAGQRMICRLRRRIFAAIIQQEISFFDESRTGELTNRLSSDAQVVQTLVTGNIGSLIQNSIHIVGSLVVLFYLEVTLTLVLIATVPVVVLIAMKYGQIVENLRTAFQDDLAKTGTIAEESFSNIRTVRIFGGERKMMEHYQQSLLKSFATGKKLALNDGLFSGVLGLLGAGGISAVMWYGGKLLHEKKLTAGILSSFLLYMIQVGVAFAYLASLYGEFMQAVGASKQIFALLDRRPTIPSTSDEGSSTDQPADFDGSVHFDQVSFTYASRPDQQVLKDISFSIRTGQKVALVGPSGSGKSTIASLIERFYEPQSGTIRLGPHSLLSTVDPQWLRRNVSFVNQEPTLFACSIRENIAFGLDPTQVSLEDVIHVARQANAHQFIDEFEHKYDTLVGERGARLSGGQRQRIAIARALLMNPKLLLLDEATSALDAESEHLIAEAIERAMSDRTVLVIAHRLSTVRNADLVIVLEQGNIIEQGTHDSLMNKDNGLYKQLALRQMMPDVSTEHS